MTTGHVFVATSLDGFIARLDGDISWLPSDPSRGEDHGYERFLSGVDGILMGRGTFEKVLAFDEWPYPKPVVVMSQSLRFEDIPSCLRGKVDISAETPEAVMARLSGMDWRRVYVDGGQLVQSFLRAGLIHELTVTRIPVLLGTGRGLFGSLSHDVMLDHVETTSFPSGLVQSRYRIQRDR